MAAAMRNLELLALHRQTAFTFDHRGRMIRERAPDRSRGKRFSFTGCREGNLGVIRDDVSDPAALELERLLLTEPPLSSRGAVPVHLGAYLRVLDSPIADHLLGLLWVFPAPLRYAHDAHLVWSGTGDGDRLLARFSDVVRGSLLEAGFREPGDIWAPWCVALVDGQVVSVAETVRTGPHGAEVGVDTEIGFRGLGLGAAATAGWAAHRDLDQRTLFYSTNRDNRSSQRVAARLGLSFIGSTFAAP
jgi:YD repeat-containing protein